jgi:probable phosphoglycerate mutase
MAGPVTRILLIRHGQSEWNESGRWQGQSDPPLTDRGRQQAFNASRSLGTVDAIWASDLQRAATTAAIIGNELGVGPIILEEDLRERDAGEWSGLTRSEIDDQYPGYLEPLEGTTGEGWVARRPPSWESDEALGTRVRRALLRIRDEVGPGEVLAVAHAGLIYLVERALGVEATRLANLDGRWIEMIGGGRPHGEAPDDFAGVARLGDRISLLAPDQITVPGQI